MTNLFSSISAFVRRLNWPITVGILTVLFCFGLVTNLTPWLRGGFGWVWPYALPRWLWLLPCAVGVIVYCWGAYRLLKSQSVYLRLWAFVGAVLLPLLLLTLDGSPLYLLFTRTVSVVTGGYEYASTLISADGLGQTLSHWPDFVQQFRTETNIFGGVALDPPGLTAIFYGFQRFFAAVPALGDSFGLLLRPLECQNLTMTAWTNAQYAASWIEIAMPIWAAFTIVPLYRLARSLFGIKTARLSIALWPLIPGIALFTPRFNVLYPLFTVGMLLLLCYGFKGKGPRSAWLVGAAGFVVSVATFLNFSLIPLGLLGGLWIIFSTPGNSDHSGLAWRLTLSRLIYFGIGSASVWLVYGALSGVTIFDIATLSLSQHLLLDRPYLPWLFLHPYDMFIFIGLPLTGAAIGRVIEIRSRWRLPLRATDRFGLALTLTLIVLTLSGTARGETGRVWLFFAPAWLLLAADWLSTRPTGDLSTRFARFVPLQALCLLSMAAVLQVHFTALTIPPDPPAATAPTYTLNAQFANGTDHFMLDGLTVDQKPGQINLLLHWRTDELVGHAYVFSLVIDSPDHQKRASLNWAPYNWEYPTTCWVAGREFVDVVTIPNVTTPGDWLFSLSASDALTHQPIMVNGQPQIGIGPVHVAN